MFLFLPVLRKCGIECHQSLGEADGLIAGKKKGGKENICSKTVWHKLILLALTTFSVSFPMIAIS